MRKEYFLEQIKEKYPDNFSKYDYSLLPNEFKVRDNVQIKCLIHGITFKQEPNNHNRGGGCSKCKSDKLKLLKTSNSDDFIKKARLKHENVFNYDKVNYVNNVTGVIITCPKGHEFIQRPHTHLLGFGCTQCRNNDLTSNSQDFIRKAKEIHGDKYDYSEVDYIRNNIKVKIYCKKHQAFFYQTPGHHLSGKGCIDCSGRKKLTTEKFISKAKNIHGDKYDYSEVNYVNNNTKVKIKCKNHNKFFYQTPNDHFFGRGCNLCRESHGERYISLILDRLNVKYVRECRIEGYGYKYDFYLPHYDIYIEYHGIQHYQTSNFFGGKKHFSKQKKRDKAKIELIKRSSGLLIVIKYTFDTLEKIEEELMRLFGFIHPEFHRNPEKTKQAIIESRAYLISNGKMYKRK